MTPWNEEDLAFHADVVHKIYEGVLTNNTDLLSETLVEVEKHAMKRAYRVGFFYGFLIGLAPTTILSLSHLLGR